MPITPGALEASNLFRAQLLAQERRAASAMVRYYGHIWTRLQPQIAALQTEVTAAQAAGAELSKAKLWQLQRLQAIETQVARELTEFSQYAGEAITAQQRVSITLAEQHAQVLLEAALPADAAALATFGRMPRAAVEALVGSLAEGSPLAALIQEAVGDAAGAFMETLVEGLALGWNPRKTAAALRQRFGMGLTDALRIARTGQLHAYRTATLRAYRESGIVVEWERMSAQDDRVCMACILLDGKIYTLEEDMDDHPNGRCLTPGQMIETIRGPVPIEEIEPGNLVLTHAGRFRSVTAIMQREYDGPVVIVTQGHQSITLTPEHPVKTDRGWIQGKDLRTSDTLLTLNERLVRASSRSTVQPRPASNASFRPSTSRLPFDLCHGGSSSTANFSHGKAKSMLNRSTAYSGTGYSPLPMSAIINWNSPGLWLSAQFFCLVLARLQRALSEWFASVMALRKSGLRSIWRRTASCGVMGVIPHSRIKRMSDLVLMFSSAASSRYVASSPRYRRVRQSQIGSPIRSSRSIVHLWEMMRPRSAGVFFNPSNPVRWWTALVVRPGRSAAASAALLLQKVARIKFSSALVHRFPVIIDLLACIGIIIHQAGIDVKFNTYSGTVYNLMVDGDESYIANGIAVHNCSLLPVTKTWRELGLDVDEPDFSRELSRDWFMRQDAETQSRMMGPGAWQAWQDDKFALDDIPKLVENDVWGNGWVSRSLKELLQ